MRVAWTGADADADEQELLVSFDGGVHFARLTANLAPDQRTYAWRVPNLPASGIVLALREGEEERESVVALCGPLEIVGDPDARGPALRDFEGEIWITNSAPVEAPEAGWAREAGIGRTLLPGLFVIAPGPRQDAAPAAPASLLPSSHRLGGAPAPFRSELARPALSFPRRN